MAECSELRNQSNSTVGRESTCPIWGQPGLDSQHLIRSLKPIRSDFSVQNQMQLLSIAGCASQKQTNKNFRIGNFNFWLLTLSIITAVQKVLKDKKKCLFCFSHTSRCSPLWAQETGSRDHMGCSNWTWAGGMQTKCPTPWSRVPKPLQLLKYFSAKAQTVQPV